MPLLTTKLTVPPLRPNRVPRPQLIERLNQGLQRGHSLTLISAPAGFGKSTVASEWLLELQATDGRGQATIDRTGWLALDEGDGDPARFLTYFIAALKGATQPETTFGEGALSMLQSPQPPPLHAPLSSLINDVAALDERAMLVVDDYHLAESAAVAEALTFLLERLPAQLHLAIVTRVDPNLPLARFRARGQLTELRAADLRFDTDEASAFFNGVMGLELARESVASLEARTEGWISGLQLAALALQGAIAARGQDAADDLIASFSGSHHFVVDYLLEEVLEQQTATVERFLLQTAVLERLTGPLCDALTGGEDGWQTLEALEQANLFVVPLDEERRWYRYHHLFAELLRRRLRQQQPDRAAVLHGRAGEWYWRNGFVDEAVEHTLHAGEVERAAGMIEENADALWRQGEHLRLHRWLAALPLDLIFSRPQLALFDAWDNFAAGQQDAAERSLGAVEQALNPDSAAAPGALQLEALIAAGLGRKNLRGRVSAIRAFLASHRSEAASTIEHARRALDDLPQQALSWRSAAAIALGDAYVFAGDYQAAHQARLEALETSRAAGNSYLYMNASLKFALNLRAQGRLQQTIEVCQDRLKFADEHGMGGTDMAGWLLAIWAEVLAETGELDRALELARRGVVLTEGGRDVAMLGWSFLCLTRVLFSRGEFAAVAETIIRTEELARDHTVPPWITKLMAAWHVRLWLAQDRLEEALEWARERPLDPEKIPTHVDALEYIALARILIHQGAADEAIGVLERLLKPAEAGGHVTRLIELLLLQSLALQAQRRVVAALATLEEAISRAEQGGYVRIFVDEGPEMARLLYELGTRGEARAYAKRLLAAFPVAEPGPADYRERSADSPGMIEPLSERETEVLQLISEGLTNRQIAERLYLSLNTVKAHTRNIYGKLGVHSRTQAVASGRALDLLTPT